jgi:type I restriction enzyme, R subunit
MAKELERQTRGQRIDPRLKTAGWSVVPFVLGQALERYGNAVAIEEFDTENGSADYALCDHSEVLAVVEAKKVTLGPQGVLSQAERYSRGTSVNPIDYGDGFRVPFLYSTNGEVLWFHDIRAPLNRSRRVEAFHTPSALRELLDRDGDAEAATLAAIPAHPMIRPYQLDANEAIEQAIRHRKRRMLVTMATGTGKTLTLVNEVHRLMKAGVARRVLFLVDRRALAAQTVRAFGSFEAEPGLKFDKVYETYSQRFFRDDLDDDRAFDPKVIPTGYLTDPKPGQAFVYVSTIQRMTINLFGRDAVLAIGDEAIDEDADKLDIPIHAFDLIIADECHRGYSARELSTWRKTLDHFD